MDADMDAQDYVDADDGLTTTALPELSSKELKTLDNIEVYPFT